MTLQRRAFIRGAAAAVAAVASPGLVRAQSRELVIGGPGAFGTGLRENFFSRFEREAGCRIIFEGSVSLTNLEKLRANRARQTYSVVMIDDPVMVIADNEGLLERITVEAVPNRARIDQTAVHRDGAWVNYQAAAGTIAYNSQALPNGIASWADAWDPRYRGKVVIPALRNTEGVLTLIMAAHLETGLPFDQAQRNIDRAFPRVAALRPNLLTVYANAAQGWTLLEQGEASIILSAPAQPVAARKAQGVPIDVVASPREGAFAMPNGIALVKGGPNPDLAARFVDAMLSEPYQSMTAGVFNANPVNPNATTPPGFNRQTNLFRPDWAYVSANREAWSERWAREIGG